MSQPSYSIYSTEYQQTFKGKLLFEVISLYGRIFLSKKPKLNSHKNYLNLGCGHNKIPGWINADFFADIKPWKIKTKRPDWMLDLRYPLKCPDNVWNGVFTEHTLEHLFPTDVLALLKELKRTMVPGAYLRITVPNLKKYVDFYCNKEVDKKFLRYETKAAAMRSLTQNNYHVSLWDAELLGIFLKQAGFVEIREVEFMKGKDTSLLKEKEGRSWETLYVEARKPK